MEKNLWQNAKIQGAPKL